ncbi:DUF3152 domain-containing protein [Streptomyces sp. NPDC006193]|uniref:DUF3152 domain-containing protein n=1 Tax=Streptomyces sp. NPDC006193 TaxID=3155717 RepID=UPI0033B435AF
MGRHSRRGPVPKDEPADTAARRGNRWGARAEGRADGAPGQGAPDPSDPAPAQGAPRFSDGTRAPGTPRIADGTPGLPDGTPARGAHRPGGDAPVRGAHPEQREAGGGWGEFAHRPAGAAGGPEAGGPGVVLPRQRQAGPDGSGRRHGSGPRQEYLEAFEDWGQGARDDEDVDLFAPRTRPARRAGQQPAGEPQAPASAAGGAAGTAQRGGGKGLLLTGVAAAAVTAVLAVLVAGQAAEGRHQAASGAPAGAGRAQGAGAPAVPSAVPLTYDEKMGAKYPLSATLKGSGRFDTVPGLDKAPGRGGRTYRYRVDVEQGLGLDGALFAEAVQKTLNDDRSWAHDGALAFERVSSGKPDFVITLASPGTTAEWCAKSGLDTTEDNVSCDSAATERVMINAYRWAQGSETYGDAIHAYRQMLINHEVGHRLGHGHVNCRRDGERAPVMQQQTKFLDHDGIHCLPNPWPYPRS